MIVIGDPMKQCVRLFFLLALCMPLVSSNLSAFLFNDPVSWKVRKKHEARSFDYTCRRTVE